MTVKEVAQALGISEKDVRSLIQENAIDYQIKVVPTLVVEKKIGRLEDKKIYNIAPEEVDSIDWWINYGRYMVIDHINDPDKVGGDPWVTTYKRMWEMTKNDIYLLKILERLES